MSSPGAICWQADDMRGQGAAASHGHGGHGCQRRVGDDLNHEASLLFNLGD